MPRHVWGAAAATFDCICNYSEFKTKTKPKPKIKQKTPPQTKPNKTQKNNQTLNKKITANAGDSSNKPDLAQSNKYLLGVNIQSA